MRVTDKMLFDRATRDGGRARERLEEAVAKASSGARVVHPGDDPAAAGLVTIARAQAERNDSIAEAAGRAADELNAVDGALSEVVNGLTRARELAIQLSSAGYSASQRSGGAKEVRQLLAASIASLNTRVGSRYVFGGRLDGAPPFDATGAYSGDDGVREVEIAPGVLQAANVRADVAVKGASGGVDLLATLDSLATALEANDPVAARGTLDALDAGTKQLSLARTDAGIAMAAFDTSVSASRGARDEARTRASHLTDADVIDSSTELALAQRALEAVLTSTSQGFKLTLLNKLG